jgi:hypothetical protein
MADSQKTYWSFFNLAGRFIGVCFGLIGLVFVIYGAASGGAVYLVPGLVVAVLGALLLMAKPYRAKGDGPKV